MKVLIVDDQYEGKARVITGILSSIGVTDITMVPSSRDALQKLAADSYELLILDLYIPSAVGEEIDSSGGIELLRFIEVNPKINKPRAVIGVTSHADAFANSEGFFKARGWTLLHGDSDPDALRILLETQCAHLRSQKTLNFDVAVITALPHTELPAVLEWECNWKEFTLPGRPEIFHGGEFVTSKGERKTIVAVSSPGMGMTSAAIVTTVLCERFSPKLLIMTGIAAGIMGKVNIGDILVASPTWDWGSGKLTVKEGVPQFLAAPVQVALDPAFAALFSKIATTRQYLDHIFVGWKKKRPTHDLNVHVGPIATGAVVLEDPATVQLIKSQHRNTIGVEMEAFGVMSAAFYASDPKPKVIVMKSVCDFADPLKNDEWQDYAAYTSASLAFMFITNNFF